MVILVERVSRYTPAGDLAEGPSAELTLACLLELFDRVPEHLRRSLTWDQGVEMADWAKLQATLHLSVEFPVRESRVVVAQSHWAAVPTPTLVAAVVVVVDVDAE